jgi:hypothetical protein
MQGTPFFLKIISDLKQLDYSDNQRKVELYAGLHTVKRKVIITGWPVNINDITLEYLISYYYTVNGVDYSLDADPSYQPKSGRYVCSHIIYQKFVFNGTAPILTNFNSEDIQTELANQVEGSKYNYMTEYEMWRLLLTDRKIYFKIATNEMAVDVDFNSLMSSAIDNLDEKETFDLI